jgi:hypothetical protein
MGTWGRIYITIVILIFLGLAACPSSGWGQPLSPARSESTTTGNDQDPLIGPTIEVEGRVKRRKAKERWERLRHREPVFLDDIVRTGAAGSASILLERYRRIETLEEHSEAHFFRGASQCNREEEQEITALHAGILWVVAKAFMELRTKNTVICVRGTSFLVQFTTPPDTTEIITLEGILTVRNSHRPGSKAIEGRPNSRIVVNESQEPVIDPIVFPAELPVAALIPEIGSNPQTDAIIDPSVSPAFETNLELTVVFPR